MDVVLIVSQSDFIWLTGVLSSLNGACLHFHLFQWHLVYGTFEQNKPARCSYPCQRPDMRLLLLCFMQEEEVLLPSCFLVIPKICKTRKVYDERYQASIGIKIREVFKVQKKKGKRKKIIEKIYLFKFRITKEGRRITKQ